LIGRSLTEMVPTALRELSKVLASSSFDKIIPATPQAESIRGKCLDQLADLAGKITRLAVWEASKTLK
jgi:hypothetical protein